MSKIVYLFGAGASFGKRDENDSDEILEGLPIVSEFPKQIDKLIQRIKTEDTEANSQHKLNPEKKLNLIAELKWLKESCENHQTVDTYAKKLYVTGKTVEYKKLKVAISAFLTLAQLFNKPDSRYDAFFANILGSSVNYLPKDVSILSWNYDCQFEKSFSNYFGNSSLNRIWEHLNIKGKTTNIRTNNNDGFSITKINGTALTFEESMLESQFLDPFFGRQGMSEISYISTAFIESLTSSNVRNALSFAWESSDSDFKNIIQSVVQDTEVLVVIGYSFPYFNREIDRLIIRNMINLKKVYIQDPNCSEVKESFEATLSDSQVVDDKIKYVLKKGISQFLIPNEM